MTDPIAALQHWFDDPERAVVQPVATGGFSGAEVWRVEYAGEVLALKKWPGKISSERVAAIHDFQRGVVRLGFPAPKLRRSPLRNTAATINGSVWELARWMPGAADYWTNPTPQKLAAALSTLARLHASTAPLIPANISWMPKHGPSPALRRRGTRLEELLAGDLRRLTNIVRSAPPGPRSTIARGALELVEKVASRLANVAPRWWDEPLPMGWCLRDIWHDHILFTGDEVTGILDFGAVGFDAPAGDVARLLGSLVGDDAEGWRTGLAAYEAVRPLSSIEREAVAFFDSSGTVLSAVNWVHWLFRDPSALAPNVDRAAAFARLERLIGRLRYLAQKQPV
jgi:Ser/Thr protein kinase RdoA (MazF antagonist)